MRKRLQIFLYTVLLLLSTQVAVAENHSILLNSIDGKKHALSEYIGHGQWVIVNVWATACPYCRQELFDLNNFHTAHYKKDAMVVGLTVDWPSFDDPERSYLTDFAESHFIDYPLLMVNGALASQVIGQPVNMVPLSFVYNPQGQLVRRINGMVTQTMLEAVIKSKGSQYRTDWADEVPPEYQQKNKK